MNFKEWSEEIKNSLTIDQVYDFLNALDGSPKKQNENLILARTICHGGDSHKLYYYNNTKLFKCYTECSDSFDIYDLFRREQKTQGKEISLIQAIYFIINFFQINTYNYSSQKEDNQLEDWKILNGYLKSQENENKKQIIDFRFYDESILKFLPTPLIKEWQREGITKEVMNYNHIAYNPVSQGIVIPHYDKNNKLIGIRERTLIKENENNGKYKPAILNYQMYSHPLGFNLYNLNNSKNGIKVFEKVIVFEGEKSCLLYQSYFGIENDISVAVCGSNLTNYQIYLLKECGAKELCLAFDKQFKEIGDEEWKGWTKKLKDIHKKYGDEIQISFLFDKWNLLGYKDSPIDRGPEIFIELFNRRVVL